MNAHDKTDISICAFSSFTGAAKSAPKRRANPAGASWASAVHANRDCPVSNQVRRQQKAFVDPSYSRMWRTREIRQILLV
ncbi:hypothetical protein Trydic_g16098 [Trypoxylus dichotomus]